MEGARIAAVRFGSLALEDIPLDEPQRVLGAVLGHNVYDAQGRRVLRKGTTIDRPTLEALRALGRSSVFAALLEPGDVAEDAAAERIARAVVGPGLRLAGPRTGRVNVHAELRGVVQVEVEQLAELNRCAGVTLATLARHTPVREGRMVGTIKILPYALRPEVVEEAVRVGQAGPILSLSTLAPRRVGLIVTAGVGNVERVAAGFSSALGERLEALGSRLERVDTLTAHQEASVAALAAAIGQQLAAGLELVILAGETAIQDQADLAPRAVEEVGGVVECFGAPVDPGNLMMLGYVGSTPVLGAPGCARSPKRNIVDLLLPRLLLQERLGVGEIVSMGHGGLLEDVPERPLPRSRI